MFFNIFIISIFLLAAFSKKRYTMMLYSTAMACLFIKLMGISSTVLIYFLGLFLITFILLISLIEYCYPSTQVQYKKFTYTPYILFTVILIGVMAVNIYDQKYSGSLINIVNNVNIDAHLNWPILLKFSVILVFTAFLSLVNLDGDKNA